MLGLGSGWRALSSAPAFSSTQGPGLECGRPVLQPVVPVPLLRGHEAGESIGAAAAAGVGVGAWPGGPGCSPLSAPHPLVLRALRSWNRFCT